MGDKKKPDPRRTNIVPLDDEKLIPKTRQDFGSGLAVGWTLEFRAVPRREAGEIQEPWRILLIPTDVEMPTIALDVWGDTEIGRGSEVDVDLTGYGGDQKGISRRHALLRPTRFALFIIDLKSRNGTQLNGVAVGTGMALKLRHNDDIAFGSLHFTVNILHQPSVEG